MKWFRRSLSTDRELGEEHAELRTFLYGFVDDEDRKDPQSVAESCVAYFDPESLGEVIAAIDHVLTMEPFPAPEIAMSANKRFYSDVEVRDWLIALRAALIEVQPRAHHTGRR